MSHPLFFQQNSIQIVMGNEFYYNILTDCVIVKRAYG